MIRKYKKKRTTNLMHLEGHHIETNMSKVLLETLH